MSTGMITSKQELKERIRLTELSLLLAVLKIDPSRYMFVSGEAQGGYVTDIEAVRMHMAKDSDREERLVSAYLPSFRNHFPEHFFVEQMEESDYYPGVLKDKYLEFWSAFDTVTYRFWILFHILKLKMLLYADDADLELLFWARFGGDTPSISRKERKSLLLLRLFAPFFRGRRMFFERILPAFVKHQVTVDENMDSIQEIPTDYRNRLGESNSLLGRDFYPGKSIIENHSTFRVNVHGLDLADIEEFAPGRNRRQIFLNLMDLFTPAHLNWTTRFRFIPGLAMFIPGNEKKTGYLGFSTYLKKTV